MQFIPTTVEDAEVLRAWTAADEYHTVQNPEWWFTGSGLLSFCIHDDYGRTMFVRVDKETDELYRLNFQFAPASEVSKRRVVVSVTRMLPVIAGFVKELGAKQLAFSSDSPNLIKFSTRLGFEPSEKAGEYVAQL